METGAIRTLEGFSHPDGGETGAAGTARVSVIIAVRSITPELRETLAALRTIPLHEVIVSPDGLPADPTSDVRWVPSGDVGPAAKRDRAVAAATGDILAFLDDDSYPSPQWLQGVLRHFEDTTVAAVGGPAVTPPGERFWAAAAGAVLSSWLGSGPTRMRFVPVGSVRSVDDWPSVNLLVRRDVFAAVGGFGTTYWPGEDTVLCLEIVRRGYRILYDPAVVVYHHRATTPLRHLRQFARYGLHRGYFVRKYPATSRRAAYLFPSAAVLLGLSLVLVALGVPAVRRPLGWVVLVALGVAFASGFWEARRARRWGVAPFYVPLLVATHVTYGLAFLRGVTAPSLKRYTRASR